jgi:hypothetical protein
MDISTGSTRLHSHDNTTAPPRRLTIGRAGALTLAVYAVILAGAVALRLLLVPMYYPVLHSNLETYRFLHTLEVRDDAPPGASAFGSAGDLNRDNNYVGYPPVQLQVHAMTQRIVEANTPFPMPNDYILGARYASVIASILTTVFMAGLGWYLARPLGAGAAFMAGLALLLVWGFGADGVHIGNQALIDPLLYPYIPLIMLASVYAIRQDAPWAVLAALALNIVAIYTKYVVVYALVFPAAALLVLVWRRGTPGGVIGRLWRGIVALWPWLAVMAVLSAVSLYWLVFVNNMFGLQNYEARNFYDSGLSNAFSLQRNWVNLWPTLQWTTGAWAFGGALVGGAAAWIYSRRRGLPTFEVYIPAVVLVYAAIGFMLISSVRAFENAAMLRYTLAPMIGLLAVWGLCLGQMVAALAHLLRGRPAVLRYGAPLLVTGALLLPPMTAAVQGNTANYRAFQQVSLEEIIWAWSDATLADLEGKIMMDGRDTSWVKLLYSRVLTGYDGGTPFNFIHVQGIPEVGTPESYWHEAGISYFVLSDEVADEPEIAAFVQDLALLKTFPEGDNRQRSYVYRMLPPQVSTDAVFGGHIRLAGYDLNSDTLAPGDVLAVRPFWRVTEPPTDNYSMYVHLRPADDPTTNAAQYDGPPAAPERLPVTWTDTRELIVGGGAQIALPHDLRPGDYDLWLGLYNFTTGERLTLPDGSDGYPIPMTIAPQND